MPTRKAKEVQGIKVENSPNTFRKSTFRKIKTILATIFYIEWIIIGLFFLLIIFGEIKQGALNSILKTPSSSQSVPQVQTPTETDLPGVGKVNIACVQQSLDAQAIQKIITEGNTSTLTNDEKSKLEPCVVEPESATPTPIPQ